MKIPIATRIIVWDFWRCANTKMPTSEQQQSSISRAGLTQHCLTLISCSFRFIFALQLHHTTNGFQMVTVYACWKWKITFCAICDACICTEAEDEKQQREVEVKEEEDDEKHSSKDQLPFQLLFCIVWLPHGLNHGRVIRRYRMVRLHVRYQNTR